MKYSTWIGGRHCSGASAAKPTPRTTRTHVRSIGVYATQSHSQRPYSLDEEKVVRIPFRNIDAVGPAGSINSSVAEMMPYIQFHIDLGLHGENRLLSENNARKMQLPQMAMAGPIARRIGEGEGDEVADPSYGLGLMVTTYRGHKLVQHVGASTAWPGCRTITSA